MLFKTISKFTACLAMAALLMTSCTKDNDLVTAAGVSNVDNALNIVGTWTQQTSSDTKVTFNPDGTGTASTVSPFAQIVDGVVYTDFNWAVSDATGEAATMKQLDVTYAGAQAQNMMIENMNANEIKIGDSVYTRDQSFID